VEAAIIPIPNLLELAELIPLLTLMAVVVTDQRMEVLADLAITTTTIAVAKVVVVAVVVVTTAVKDMDRTGRILGR